MKLIQITDLHITDFHEDAHGIDVKQNLKTIIQSIKNVEFDALIITGDLAFRQANENSYEFIVKELTQISKPTYVIGGNHDSFEMLRNYFPQSFNREKSYYSAIFNNQLFLFLDSSKSFIDSEQLEWIKNQLSNINCVNIFIHHPILKTDIVFMESKYSLINRDELRDILVDFGKPVSVFCGHFHAESTNKLKKITQYLTPSTFYQINPLLVKFAIGNFEIGYRIIDIENSKLSTRVIWI